MLLQYGMNARDLTALVHLVGFGTGIVLYTMLGVMTRRRLANVTAPAERKNVDRVPLAAALLGVIWNVGAMVVFAARDFGANYELTWVAAIAYGALGFLPAVVVHSTLRRAQRADFAWFLGVAYTASGVAAVMHVADALRGQTPSSAGTPAAHHHVWCVARRARRHRAPPTGLSANDPRRRAGGVRGLGAAPEPQPGSGRSGTVARRADRSPRVASARSGDPVSGLSLRVHGSLPQARAVIAGARRSRVVAVRLLRGAARRSACVGGAPTGARWLASLVDRSAPRTLDRHRARVPVHPAAHLPFRRSSDSAATGLSRIPRGAGEGTERVSESERSTRRDVRVARRGVGSHGSHLAAVGLETRGRRDDRGRPSPHGRVDRRSDRARPDVRDSHLGVERRTHAPVGRLPAARRRRGACRPPHRRTANRRGPPSARAARAGDAAVGGGGRASRAAGAAQSTLSVQRAQYAGPPDADGAQQGAGDAVSAHESAAQGAAANRWRLRRAARRARHRRGVSGDRARAIRGASRRVDRRARGSLARARPAAVAATARRERGQARDRADAGRRTRHGAGATLGPP